KKEDGWHVKIEMVERHALPDSQDLLGVYEVIMDDGGRLVNYERRRVRRRNEVEETTEYE
ncbi:MAG: gas vesicle protein GvpO, partial [Bacteroidota bacterium]